VTRPPVTHAPHIFVDDLDGLDLDPADDHHLRVLRIQLGAPVVACDGAGSWRLCRRATTTLEPDGPTVTSESPVPSVAIAFALTKGDKPELVVQKLTELGVDRIVPFFAERSVVRWDDERAQRNVERLRRVAREAAMQSRRITLPAISAVARVADIAAAGFVRADRDGAPLSLAHSCVAIGPEGGWSDDEARAWPGAVTLSATVLRAETAAIAAASLLLAHRERLWAG
jgi:16S rRNA (uracil1498-N3)-methyltransferase